MIAHLWQRLRPIAVSAWPFFTRYAAGISLALGALGALFGFLSYEAAWTIAKLSGSLDKPVLSVAISGVRLRADETSSVIIGLPQLGDKQTVSIGTLPLTMVDEGAKSVEHPVLLIRYPGLMQRKVLDDLKAFDTEPIAAVDVQRSITSNAGFDYAAYRLAAIDPGVGITIEDPIYGEKTTVEDVVQATAKDGVRVSVSYRLDYAVPILATTIGQDVPAANYEITLAFVRAKSLSEVQAFALKTVVSGRQKQFRQATGFWPYLSALLFRSESRDVFLMFEPTKDYRVAGQGHVYVAESKRIVAKLTYNLLSWDELF